MKKTRRDFLKSVGISAVAAGAVMGGADSPTPQKRHGNGRGRLFVAAGTGSMNRQKTSPL